MTISDWGRIEVLRLSLIKIIDIDIDQKHWHWHWGKKEIDIDIDIETRQLSRVNIDIGIDIEVWKTLTLNWTFTLTTENNWHWHCPQNFDIAHVCCKFYHDNYDQLNNLRTLQSKSLRLATYLDRQWLKSHSDVIRIQENTMVIVGKICKFFQFHALNNPIVIVKSWIIFKTFFNCHCTKLDGSKWLVHIRLNNALYAL